MLYLFFIHSRERGIFLSLSTINGIRPCKPIPSISCVDSKTLASKIKGRSSRSSLCRGENVRNEQISVPDIHPFSPPPLLFSRFGSSHAPLCRILRFFAFVLRRKQILVENCEEKKRILRVSLSLRINLFVVVVLKSCAVNK